MEFWSICELVQIICQFAVVLRTHGRKCLSAHEARFQACDIKGPLWHVGPWCDPEALSFRMSLHQKFRGFHGDKVGESLVHLLDDIKRPVFQRVRSDWIELHLLQSVQRRGWKSR